MKFKFVLSLCLLGGTFSMFAQGYKDGVEYYKVNQYENANELLQRNLNNPETNKAQAYYYLGAIALQNGNKAQAKTYFDQGIAANATDGYNYVGLGALALADNNPKLADDSFKKAISMDKKDPELAIAIARSYYNANPVAYAKDITKYINQAKKINKTNPAPYILEGDMLAAEKKYGDAAGYYEMAENFDNNCGRRRRH